MLAYPLAVLAACANAISSVLQRQANRKVPRKQNLSWRLVWSLLHEPVWFGGILAVTIGFLLQATALGNGQLAVVEPVLVLELPATLILASRVFHSNLHRREWLSIAIMTVSLAVLLYSLSPSGTGASIVPWYRWVIGAGINLAVAGALVALGRRRPAGVYRAALLGVAGGATFGLTAALMKGMTATYSQGIAALFTSWELYGMIAAGVLGMFLVQSAMNAGRLLAAQPGLTLSDPLVSILWGLLAFDEKLRGGIFILPAAVSGVAMVAAVVILARSPLLSQDSVEDDARSRPAQAELDRVPGGATSPG